MNFIKKCTMSIIMENGNKNKDEENTINDNDLNNCEK